MGEKGLSAAEAELYDRQIRLWGIESQEKLRAANVLLIGVRGLGSEIAKNILLSGINSLTILDDGIVTELEYLKNFLLCREDIGNKIAEAVLLKAQALNPLVKIVSDTSSLADKNEQFYSNFTIIIATGLNTKQILSIDSICRNSNIQFICGDVFGMFGYSLSDFHEHEYFEDQITLPKSKKRTHEGKPTTSNEKVITKIQRKVVYPALSKVLSKSEKKIVNPSNESKRKRRNELYYLVKLLIQFRDENGRDPSNEHKSDDLKKLRAIREDLLEKYQIKPEKFKEETLSLLFGEMVSISSIIGGVIAQEVIKAVSHKEVPIHNMFLLDPHTFSGKEEIVGA